LLRAFPKRSLPSHHLPRLLLFFLAYRAASVDAMQALRNG
jgi:hypothetical protein